MQRLVVHSETAVEPEDSAASVLLSARQDLDDAVSYAKLMLSSVDADVKLSFARSIVYRIVRIYWQTVAARKGWRWNLRNKPHNVEFAGVPSETEEWSETVGAIAANLDPVEAAYRIGVLYTAMMPQEVKAKLGAHYTPPALCEELLNMATENGVDWRTARVLDPACGGGAFLAPVARRMVSSVGEHGGLTILEDIEQRLTGYEIDPFAAWLSRIFLDAVLGDLSARSGRRHRCEVKLCNSLEKTRDGEGFDLVIGNPPYGRMQLPQKLRTKFARSLFGHANLYGLFTDQALRLLRQNGLIAYVTPTSLLSGEYFKALRGLLAEKAPPVSLGFVTERKGVFDEVLQETMLAIYRRGRRKSAGNVSLIKPRVGGAIETTSAGQFNLPLDSSSPWLIPRSERHGEFLRQIRDLSYRLSDFGYTVSTGPLVWNRHKPSLRKRKSEGTFPIIWAEAVRPEGRFEFRSLQRNHEPFFKPQPQEQWVVTDCNCVLLHRTTAIEQNRRLIAAELPNSFITEHGAVVVENHLNMVKPIVDVPKISPRTVAAVLNSSVIDQLFRCINGSVAVSAFELKALPLPSPKEMETIEKLVSHGVQRDQLEHALMRAYKF